jgi:hypothetical protein
MLSADELLAGGALTHEVTVPPTLLGPTAPAHGRVRLRPLTVRDLTLISRAAKDNDQLLSALMVQAALDEPRLTLAQVNALPVGLLEFLLREVNRVSGIVLEDGTVRQAAADPLVRAAHLLSAEFGWTPDEVAGLTLGQMLVHLELIRERRGADA